MVPAANAIFQSNIKKFRHYIIPSKNIEIMEDGDEKCVRARSWTGMQQIDVFWTWYEHCVYVLMEALVVCKRFGLSTFHGECSGELTGPPSMKGY